MRNHPTRFFLGQEMEALTDTTLEVHEVVHRVKWNLVRNHPISFFLGQEMKALMDTTLEVHIPNLPKDYQTIDQYQQLPTGFIFDIAAKQCQRKLACTIQLM